MSKNEEYNALIKLTTIIKGNYNSKAKAKQKKNTKKWAENLH